MFLEDDPLRRRLAVSLTQGWDQPTRREDAKALIKIALLPVPLPFEPTFGWGIPGAVGGGLACKVAEHTLAPAVQRLPKSVIDVAGFYLSAVMPAILLEMWGRGIFESVWHTALSIILHFSF
jgi:hypothetical protein